VRKEDGAVTAPGEIPAGTRAYGRLRLESPAVVTRGDRFILRAYSPAMTIAGGRVLDPHPPRAGIRRAGSRARFEHLDPDARPTGAMPADPDERALLHALGDSGSAGLAASALTSRLGIVPAGVDPLIDRSVSAGHAARVGEVLVAAPGLGSRGGILLAMVGDHHKAQPLSEGVPREEARERLFAGAGAGVFERVLAALAASDRIVARDRLALATYRMALSADEERARTRIEARFRDAGLKPPDEASLAEAVGVAPAVADRMVKLLVRQKVLARVESLVFHEDALAQLKRDVAAMKATAGGSPATIDVATFKERYAVTRKFAIPLLEYLDRERITRRAGDVRVIV